MKDGQWNAGVTIGAGVVLGVIGTAFVTAVLKDPDAGDWLQFAGSLTSGFATLGAAIIAWLALKQQITAHEGNFSIIADEHRKRTSKIINAIIDDIGAAKTDAARSIVKMDKIMRNPSTPQYSDAISDVAKSLNDQDIWRVDRSTIRLINRLQDRIEKFNSEMTGARVSATIATDVKRAAEDIVNSINAITNGLERKMIELGEPRTALPGQKFAGHFYPSENHSTTSPTPPNSGDSSS